MKKILLLPGVFLVFACKPCSEHVRNELRAAEIVSQMTIEENIDYVGASSADIRLEASFNVE